MTSQETRRIQKRIADMLQETEINAKVRDDALERLKTERPLPEEPWKPSEDAAQLSDELVKWFNLELTQARMLRDGKGSAEDLQGKEEIRKRWPSILADKVLRDWTFNDIETLTRGEHPEHALICWEEIKAAARRDLESGMAAARFHRSGYTDAWAQALYIAIRERLYREWQPTQPGERPLLDRIARIETLWLTLIQRPGSFDTPSELDQMTRTVDRAHTIYERLLRLLIFIRDQPLRRRGSVPNQVNIAIQQQLHALDSLQIGSIRPASAVPDEERATICNTLQHKTLEVSA